MNYYKLDVIQHVLRQVYDAERVSVGPKPRVEVWKRVVGDDDYRAFLTWEHGEEIITHEEAVYVAEALRVHPADFVTKVRERGGLWLGPNP